jgi:nitrous oxide reductase
MNSKIPGSSRRRFLGSTCLAAVAGAISRRSVLAEDESPVTVIRTAAATAKITVQKLRGNISVLLGSGGNIGVLTGVIDGTTFTALVYAGV